MDDITDTDVAARKRALRARIVGARRLLPPDSLRSAGAAIAQQLLHIPAVTEAPVVAAYASVGTEVPTGPFIDALHRAGTTVLLPLLESDNSLTWRAVLTAADVTPGRHGLLEPQRDTRVRRLDDAAIVVLPGLAYDARGNRLGRGGGSYDRSLADLPATTLTVGVALDCDIIDEVPAEPHDQPVAMIVTPTRVITIDDGGH